jgi:hypothetical protein
MLLSHIVGGFAALPLLANGVSATIVPQRREIPMVACKTHLVIDDFTTWSTGVNTVQGATSGKSSSNQE